MLVYPSFLTACYVRLARRENEPSLCLFVPPRNILFLDQSIQVSGFDSRIEIVRVELFAFAVKTPGRLDLTLNR